MKNKLFCPKLECLFNCELVILNSDDADNYIISIYNWKQHLLLTVINTNQNVLHCVTYFLLY